jgi:hypothetical protein
MNSLSHSNTYAALDTSGSLNRDLADTIKHDSAIQGTAGSYWPKL